MLLSVVQNHGLYHLSYVLLVLSTLSASVVGQTCMNYGETSPSNTSSCLCPPGFGGATCAQPGCGGTIFDGSNRSLAQPSTSSSGFANLTASDCTCESGWGGVGCNVCTTSSACQVAYAAVNGNASATSGLDGPTGLNDTMVCNTAPTVWAASELSCQVNNPTLEALYPLQSTLNILRTLNSSLSPLHNTSGTLLSPSTSSSIYAQLMYAGVEQFFCTASPCTQTLSNTTTSSGNTTSSTWTCQNLSCTCIQNATFCGGVPVSNLTSTIDGLTGTLIVACDGTNTCHFQQDTINSVFGSQGLSMEGCVFGECVTQAVIDTTNATSSGAAASGETELSGGVIAGLAVVGVIIVFGLVVVAWGWYVQRAAKKLPFNGGQSGGIGVRWSDISYIVQSSKNSPSSLFSKSTIRGGKIILDSVSGSIESGQLMAILGPSGAGKTTLVELIAGKTKSGQYTGSIAFPPCAPGHHPRVAFVPQSDVLPSMLTVREALTFAASLRLPEALPASSKAALVSAVISKLGLDGIAETRIGATDGTGRGISGGEARRVSIGLELVGCPDVLVCDEPTSGLDSVSAFRVVNVLKELAREGGIAISHQGSHGHRKGVAVICSVHQPSSRLYHTFDSVHLLSKGRALYSGPGGLAPAQYFMRMREGGRAGADVLPYEEGYNVADYLLDIASESPDIPGMPLSHNAVGEIGLSASSEEKADGGKDVEALLSTQNLAPGTYVATFLTQLQVLCGREWKVLRRDKTLFFTHVCVACVLGVFCGGLYYKTGLTIAGFQARVGCLFFMGSLIAFSSLSALYNIVEIRPLFLRERSNWYYSPTAWLLSRLIFDVIPLRIIPTITVCTITYWMAGLAHDAVHFFKFLLVIVLYTLVMTLFNFLLGTTFRNGGIAILLSALSALYQMTYAGFFVHLASIPPVLRWLRWLCPLNYTLEAISVNEVSSGLMIKDTLQGVPVNVSATLIMQLLFGFGLNNYYRDILVLFAFIAGLGVAVIAMVWLKVRERR
ncbi:uncharacterized protein BJ212DRAFT_1342871 [Suillus subaureus]|uniref:ABC transporter domain-containing protein n=1 Tax=Suillus subaureus TaxID=48587 RepID=A0A9P7EFM5_9AGAM|nr:uncharacterized protein BJ212DRAFT_1342871 [Suillus subaureus]KAG1819763.1 hypothetical protein BJ212DRAFT_1342871 [Suillus subaureus]